MEQLLHKMASDMAATVQKMQDTLATALRGLDERALQEAKDGSKWQAEHAVAVENCKVKGIMAQEALDTADVALKTATEAKTLAESASSAAAHASHLATLVGRPKNRNRTEIAAYAALAGTLVNAIVEWLSRH
jgi:hypothetical protein